MPETTETPTTQTEGSTSTEAAATTLLSSTEPAATTQQTTETTQEPAKTTEETTETAKPEGAPEKYEFVAPEGKEYDPAILEPFSEAAKEANLTQDSAQKLLEKMAPALADRQQKQVEAVQTGWLEASKADKEFGGEKLSENLGIARKAIDQFTSPEFRQMLNDSRLGNNPEVIRTFYRIGKAISEDGFIPGGGKTASAKTAAEILYDNTK